MSERRDISPSGSIVMYRDNVSNKYNVMYKFNNTERKK